MAAAAVLILTNIWMIDGAPFLRAIQPLLSAAFGLSAVALFASLDTLAIAPKIRSAMLFAGRVSYPIYLFHLVILIACQKYGLALNLSAYCLAAVLLSAAFNFGFEQPLLAMRPSYRSRAKTAQPDTTVLAK
jgi:peptidoglycan/LPS O-acetylase OafA/YrhL